MCCVTVTFCAHACTLFGPPRVAVPVASPDPPSAASGGLAVSEAPATRPAATPAQRAGSPPPAAALTAASPGRNSYCERNKEEKTERERKRKRRKREYAKVECYTMIVTIIVLKRDFSKNNISKIHHNMTNTRCINIGFGKVSICDDSEDYPLKLNINLFCKEN